MPLACITVYLDTTGARILDFVFPGNGDASFWVADVKKGRGLGLAFADTHLVMFDVLCAISLDQSCFGCGTGNDPFLAARVNEPFVRLAISVHRWIGQQQKSS